METIVIEAAREAIRYKINVSLAHELIKDSTLDYTSFLQSLRTEMSSAGLTQEELDNMIRDE